MDAKRPRCARRFFAFPRVFCGLCALCALLLCTACELGFGKVKADDPAPPPSTRQQDERPIIVRSPDPREAAPQASTDRAVSEYIARIDDLAARRAADSADPHGIYRAAADEPARPSLGTQPPAAWRQAGQSPAGVPLEAATAPAGNSSPAATGAGNELSQAATSDGTAAPAVEPSAQTSQPESSAGGAASTQPADQLGHATETESTPPPPRLVGVSVRAIHAPPPPPQGDAAAPAINVPVRAALGGAAPGELLESWLGGTEPATFRDHLDRRLIQIVAGDYEAARQPVESASADQQALATGVVGALVAVREGHLGDPAKAAATALEAIEGAAEALRAQRDLEIPTIAICREVIGYGQYTPIEPPSFPAGIESEFVIYCEVRNFESRRDTDGLFQTRFSMRTTLLSRAGDAVLETEDPSILDRCRNRRRDCFIPRLIRLPATLSPGEYVAKVTLVDKLGEKVAENRATFRVSALTP